MAKNLVAVLSTGKGTWGHVSRLIREGEWGKIILVSNEYGKENFTSEKEVDFVLVNTRMGFSLMKDSIKEKLQGTKECSINLVSGSGKEHMALIVALRELKVDYDLVLLTGEGMEFFK